MFKLRPNCVSEIPEAILLVKHLMESYYAKFEFSVSQIWVKISIFWESCGLEKLARGVSHHLMTPHDDLDPLGCDFIKTLREKSIQMVIVMSKWVHEPHHLKRLLKLPMCFWCNELASYLSYFKLCLVAVELICILQWCILLLITIV